jgi:hypothetical protein
MASTEIKARTEQGTVEYGQCAGSLVAMAKYFTERAVFAGSRVQNIRNITYVFLDLWQINTHHREDGIGHVKDARFDR